MLVAGWNLKGKCALEGYSGWEGNMYKDEDIGYPHLGDSR